MTLNLIKFENKNDIIKNIDSNNPIIKINAIIRGTTLDIQDKKFITEVKKAKKSNETVLSIPVAYIASAALDVLEIEKYTGDNPFIISLITARLDVL